MPRSKIQNETIREAKKNQILVASLKLFAIYGYRQVSIDDIMDKVGSVHSLFYHYFSSKEQLFDVVVQTTYEKAKEPFRSIDYKRKAKYVLEDVITKLLEMITNQVGAAELYLLLTLHIQKRFVQNPDIGQIKFTVWGVISSLVSKGQEEGDFLEGDVGQYSAAILSMMVGLAYKGIFQKKNELILPSPKIIMNIVNKKGDRDD